MNEVRLIMKRFDKILLILSITLLFLSSQSLIGQTSGVYKNAGDVILTAQNSKQYLFLLFYDKKGESLKAMESIVNEFRKMTSKKIIFYQARTTDDKEKETIAKYGINRAPLPLLLVFAPNGAIAGGFPEKVTNQQLEKSIVSELTMKILKPLQEQKVVLVLLQNNKTTYNKESTDAATGFSNDSKLKGYVEIIKTDPDVGTNKEFLSQCKLNNKITEATIVLLIPPGSIAGVYPGKITKDTLISALASCSSGGCGSSGGGCGPR